MTGRAPHFKPEPALAYRRSGRSVHCAWCRAAVPRTGRRARPLPVQRAGAPRNERCVAALPGMDAGRIRARV